MPDENQADRSYRRGAVMGLTLAEAFILVAFALLLLFAFWQWERAKDDTPELQAINNLPYEQRQLIINAANDDSLVLLAESNRTIAECVAACEIPRVLEDSGMDIKDIPVVAGAMQSLQKKGIGPSELSAMAEAVSSPASTGELQKKWRFIDQDDARRLLDAASQLPPDMQRDLADMVESQDAQAVLKEMAQLEELVETGQEVADIIASSGVAQEIEASGMSVEDLLATAKIMQSLEQSGRTLEELMKTAEKLLALDQAGQSLADIADKIEQAQGQEQALVATLRSELGDVVSNVGGKIDDSGAVILPDSVLFEKGQAEITPVLGQFLQDACEPWLSVLKNSSVEISEVKIEGHASSEWSSSSTPQQAYLMNLDLSQRRSQAVLRECLDIVKNSEIHEWARSHMIAVGYSSVRPVVRNGEEDRAASRRVVLSATQDRESLIEAIETEAKIAATDRAEFDD